MKAAINPAINGISVALSEAISPLNISFAIFPRMRGTTIKKENLAAFSLSIPNKTETDIVAPDLEMPGRIAIA
jgi:hypothetical protein